MSPPPTPERPDERRRPLSWRDAILFGTLCLVPAVLLSPYRHAAFVADDRWFATAPLLDASGRWLLLSWPHPFGPAHAYRPLIVLSYGLTQWLTSGTPAPFHLTNFVIHGINAMLLATLIWQVSHVRLAAVLGGLLFAIHPITHENVVWISGRTYPLAALFGLALLCWTAAAVERRETRWW
jgi:hypothetical protein